MVTTLACLEEAREGASSRRGLRRREWVDVNRVLGRRTGLRPLRDSTGCGRSGIQFVQVRETTTLPNGLFFRPRIDINFLNSERLELVSLSIESLPSGVFFRQLSLMYDAQTRYMWVDRRQKE